TSTSGLRLVVLRCAPSCFPIFPTLSPTATMADDESSQQSSAILVAQLGRVRYGRGALHPCLGDGPALASLIPNSVAHFGAILQNGGSGRNSWRPPALPYDHIAPCCRLYYTIQHDRVAITLSETKKPTGRNRRHNISMLF